MKNYEKYAEEIRNYRGGDFCDEFIKPHILEKDSCGDLGCIRCSMLQSLWLLEDYEEPEVDWSKVAVDTPILVRGIENEEWNKRYFSRYENGTIYAWVNGRTSWTAYDNGDVCAWKYAKLAEQEESLGWSN